jgi:hypothetical protein
MALKEGTQVSCMDFGRQLVTVKLSGQLSSRS